LKLRGVIQSGAGRGAFFTRLEWVVEQFEKAMGFAPFPGTLNVRICDEDVAKLDAFFSERHFQLVPDDPQFCAAHLKKVRVNGVAAAAVFPSEDVRIHSKDVIEIMTYCHIKETLRLSDGDTVTITEFHDTSPNKDGWP
jgi:CTP-dependent riboflavin kinase